MEAMDTTTAAAQPALTTELPALTAKERAMMFDIINDEYSDGTVDSTPWSWSVAGTKGRAGVIGSLAQKGLVFSSNNEGGAGKDDQYVGFTAEGKRVMAALLLQDAAEKAAAAAPAGGGVEVTTYEPGTGEVEAVGAAKPEGGRRRKQAPAPKDLEGPVEVAGAQPEQQPEQAPDLTAAALASTHPAMSTLVKVAIGGKSYAARDYASLTPAAAGADPLRLAMAAALAAGQYLPMCGGTAHVMTVPAAVAALFGADLTAAAAACTGKDVSAEAKADGRAFKQTAALIQSKLEKAGLPVDTAAPAWGYADHFLTDPFAGDDPSGEGEGDEEPTEDGMAAAFRAAAQAARAADCGDDGGTCNFDTAVLMVDAKWRKRVAAAAEQVPDVEVEPRKWLGATRFFVHVRGLQGGQGDRNTRIARAIEGALQAAGLPTAMYYQMD